MSPRSFPATLKPVLSLSHSLSRTTATLLVQFLLTNTFIDVVHGVLINATIDDHYGDSLTSVVPEFLPKVAGIWEGEECGGCRVKPDPQRAFQNTYNAATYRPEAGINPAVQMRFTGNAIYVFLTLANNCGEGITTKTQANFTVDNGEPFLFSHEPDMSRTDFIYQHPAFSRTGLEHGEHTLSVFMSGPQEHLFLNFDYAIYTYDDALFSGQVTVTYTSPSSSSSQPSSTAANSGKSLAGPIAGGVAGGVAIFVLFILALLFIRRRYRKPRGPEYHNPDNIRSAGQNQHRQYPSISTAPPIPPYAHQASSRSTQSLGNTIITGISSSSGTNSSGSGSRRPQKTPHIQPFTQLRPVADGRRRGHIPQQPSLSQTQSSHLDSVRTPTPALSNQSLEYTSASSHSGQRAPVGPSALSLPSQNAADGDLDQRVQGLQQSINSMIATIQAEQETLSRRGLSEEQINASLETMRRNLASLAEQMTGLQERRRVTWDSERDGRRGGEDLPEYESPTLPSRRLPEP